MRKAGHFKGKIGVHRILEESKKSKKSEGKSENVEHIPHWSRGIN